MAKAAKKKTTAPKKRAKSVATRKAKVAKKTKRVKMKKASRKAAPNRRMHRRFEPKNLYVTELNGDYQFVARATDISEGGIFLAGRLKTASNASMLKIHLGNDESLQIVAMPVHDRISTDSYGAGYKFSELSPMQTKVLRSYLRDLD